MRAHRQFCHSATHLGTWLSAQAAAVLCLSSWLESQFLHGNGGFKMELTSSSSKHQFKCFKKSGIFVSVVVSFSLIFLQFDTFSMHQTQLHDVSTNVCQGPGVDSSPELCGTTEPMTPVSSVFCGQVIAFWAHRLISDLTFLPSDHMFWGMKQIVRLVPHGNLFHSELAQGPL